MNPESERLLALPALGDDIDLRGVGDRIQQCEDTLTEEVPCREHLHTPFCALKHLGKAGSDVLLAIDGPDQFPVAAPLPLFLPIDRIKGSPGAFRISLDPDYQVADSTVRRDRIEPLWRGVGRR